MLFNVQNVMFMGYEPDSRLKEYDQFKKMFKVQLPLVARVLANTNIQIFFLNEVNGTMLPGLQDIADRAGFKQLKELPGLPAISGRLWLIRSGVLLGYQFGWGLDFLF